MISPELGQVNFQDSTSTAIEKEGARRGIESLSIVIPALNEEQYLPNLLRSLSRQDFGGDYQVIVVDGQSTDRTVDVARNFDDRLPIEVVSTERGVGHQRNVGVEQAKYSHLVFMDSDIVVPRGFLNKLAARVDPDERIIDNVSLLPTPLKFVDTMAAMYGNGAFALISKFIEPVMIGPFMLTTKDNHQRVGGFAEGAVIGEDLDFALRSVKDGAKHHMHLGLYVLNSTRRAEEMGRLQFTQSWARAYFHVRKHGPIYKDFEYPFGHYKK